MLIIGGNHMANVSGLSAVFPTPDFARAIAFYESLGFTAVLYDKVSEPHACLSMGGA